MKLESVFGKQKKEPKDQNIRRAYRTPNKLYQKPSRM